ncbi:diacylglycerol/lipid kinase family protein [Luteococcus peritonei]|uniref:Diacylglycerol/lipid kinase family protein n=1 Tax=Luteococcus peritonei TaxID=88874 RepID=A0ABW4RUR5_9ACTN
MSATRPAPARPVAILNPVARGHARTVELLDRLAREHGWPAWRHLPTTEFDFGGSQAEQALELGADLVVVGGGDGTVRAVAERLRGTQTAIGIVPLGTANIFARNLGLSPRRLEAAVGVAMFGSPRRLDLGVACFRTESLPTQDSREHLFLVLAGLGNDALTVAATRPGLKRRLGWLAYFESGSRHLVRRPVRMLVQLDDQPALPRALWSCLVGNAPRIPMGISIFPARELDDGLLDVMEVRVTRLRQWFPIALAGARRRAESPCLVHHDARRVRLVPDEPTELQLDGDVFGPVVEATLSVHPRSLLVNTPEGKTR